MKKFYPFKQLSQTIQNGCYEVWEMAEYLDVDEPFLIEALKHYGILDIA